MVQEMAPVTMSEAQIVGTQTIQAPNLPTQVVQGGILQGTTSVVPGDVSTRQVAREVAVPQIQTVERLVEVPQIQEVVRNVPVMVPQEVVRSVPVPQIQTVEKIIEVPQIQTVEKIIQVPQVTQQQVPVP